MCEQVWYTTAQKVLKESSKMALAQKYRVPKTPPFGKRENEEPKTVLPVGGYFWSQTQDLSRKVSDSLLTLRISQTAWTPSWNQLDESEGPFFRCKNTFWNSWSCEGLGKAGVVFSENSSVLFFASSGQLSSLGSIWRWKSRKATVTRDPTSQQMEVHQFCQAAVTYSGMSLSQAAAEAQLSVGWSTCWTDWL